MGESIGGGIWGNLCTLRMDFSKTVLVDVNFEDE